MGVIEGHSPRQAEREAWTRVMDGFAAALKVQGLSDRSRFPLLHGYQIAAEAAGRPALAFVDPPAPDNVKAIRARH